MKLISTVKQVCICALILPLLATVSAAQSASDPITQERYEAAIWIDPDGCEHWVFDDGFEGFMSPHLRRNGTPVCGRSEVCNVVGTDQFFAVDRAVISGQAQSQLRKFFRTEPAAAFVIEGHTDNSASDAYNEDLALRRARAVAQIASAAGANVSAVRSFGERAPRATNETAEGRSENRRVEIRCVK